MQANQAPATITIFACQKSPILACQVTPDLGLSRIPLATGEGIQRFSADCAPMPGQNKLGKGAEALCL